MKSKIGLSVAVLLLFASVAYIFVGTVPKSEYGVLQAENTYLEYKLAEAQSNFGVASTELAKIKEVFPLRDFASYSELEQWVKANIQPVTTYATGSFQSALKVVQLGEEQGYRIGVNMEYYADQDKYLIGCNAFEGGLFYWWNPESGEIYPWDSAFRK